MKIQVSWDVKSYQLVRRHILQNISSYLYLKTVQHSWRPKSASTLWEPQISTADMVSSSWDVYCRSQIQILFWHTGMCSLRYCCCCTCKCPSRCLWVEICKWFVFLQKLPFLVTRLYMWISNIKLTFTFVNTHIPPIETLTSIHKSLQS